MLKIYKKTNKSRRNMYGFKEITNINALKNPMLLCISNNNNFNKSIFGIMRDGAHAARVHTTQEAAAKFNLGCTPIDFLGVRFSEDKEFKDYHKELVDELLLPYITMKGSNIHSLMKQARNINLFTFDSGSRIYLDAENYLYKKIEKLNYKKEEIEKILKQISFTALASDETLDKTYATTVSFIDLNDETLLIFNPKEYKQILDREQINSMYFYLGRKNSIQYLFQSKGEHSPKAFLSDMSPAKLGISAVVANFLQNSIMNMHTNNIIEINRDYSLSVLFNYGTDYTERESTQKMLDHNLYYDGAKRYTDLEAALRTEVDSAYKVIQTADTYITNYEESNKDLKNKLNTLIKEIKNHCDEDTYYEILTDAKLWFGEKKKKTKKKANKKAN